VRWKRWLDVQAPYRRHLRELDLGFILDVGCGIGRTFAHCDGNGVGIDHNPASVELARAQGFEAYEVDEFWRTSHAEKASFDSLLFSHVLEHMKADAAAALVAKYAPLLRANGRLVCLCPQEAGFRSDPSHVSFCNFDTLQRIVHEAGLAVERTYSFPFPRLVGHVFPHNEFVLIARKLA
jgi:SAM-dependent methyltransferase